MRRLCTEPCLRENKVIGMLGELWLCEFFSLVVLLAFPSCSNAWFPRYRPMPAIIGTPLASLSYTGCVCNSHLATCFPAHVFQPFLGASHADFDFHL